MFEVIECRRKPESLLATPAAGIIPFNALLRDLANVQDPQMRDPDSIGQAAKMLSDLPYIRGLLGKPAINIIGQEVSREALQANPLTRRFLTSPSKDPVWTWLARNKQFIPDPRRTKEINITLASPTVAEKRLQKEAIDARRSELGAIAAGVMTEDEVYDFIKIRGDFIYKSIDFLRKTGTLDNLSAFAEQAALNAGLSETEAGLISHRTLKKIVEKISLEAGDMAKRRLLGVSIRRSMQSPEFIQELTEE